MSVDTNEEGLYMNDPIFRFKILFVTARTVEIRNEQSSHRNKYTRYCVDRELI